jgi:hypothetical protein
MSTRFLFLVAAMLPYAAHARTGEADVREGPRGGPCFTISPREERLGTPDFQAVTVSDGRHALWHMSMPPGRTSFALSFAGCVPYGARVASLPQTPAELLAPGKVYLLHIDARPVRAGSAAASYEARFCLARRRDGNVAVHQVTANACPAGN